ncbi:LacI family DNA-binding transcriptional regulator [Pseudoduganella namucuonensis]|uniref:Transcriptional regulator, LacI family n=1 Tax=Pseudoduganella namucuonensis TaxID=1035707 RepID=A0A1I7H0M6_9BURK|nr:LacI family DNA-binding transcriptional regulator [Pseudoduganella namucuonensis]SFU54225.1 transcriptional regulator, LacI family [Pseudoduganella namucuonensis]
MSTKRNDPAPAVPASGKLASISAVAQHAGVSIATVSRVLNGTKAVNDDTRARVEAAVAALGYRANALARSLMRGETRLLLVLVPDFANPYFAEIVKGVESVTRKNGYGLVVADASETLSRDSPSLDSLYNRLADGVISLARFADLKPLLMEIPDLPWVACSEFVEDGEIPNVSIDHRQAAIDAVQYLINRGHRRIALLTADEDYQWARQRREGYEFALRRANIPIDAQLVRIARGTDYVYGMEAAGTLLAMETAPTAVFAVSDTLAIGAIKAFRRVGRRVPEDIAVMGFDDIPVARVFEPALTTIAQPVRELGATAAELLLKRLAGGPAESCTLQHALIVRASA